ncbi:MAG: aminoacyl-tRNA hydrolase [Phycisphaerae bacterium]|nr:aminoacyl-tRNA hydrolase [Phycisphaerae bacterium]
MDAQGHNAGKFVIGLGNPGRKYERTRHNVGFRVLDVLRRRWGLGKGKSAFEGAVWRADRTRGGETQRVRLLAPQTYMNCSGRAVRKMLDYYQASPESMLVVLDDLALELGRLRIRPDGSAGGHNGLDDVVRACGTQIVPRLRIGVGAPPGAMDPKDYVLSAFGEKETEIIGATIEQAADAVELWIFEDISKVMEMYNRKTSDTGV